MLTLSPAVKIYLATAPTDMRKGHDGLRVIVEQHLDEDVYSGHLFVFVSRRQDRVKILGWDRGGFVLWYKRLEKGRFRMPRVDHDQHSVSIDAGQLAMLLDGLDFSCVRRPRRWEPPSTRPRSKGIDRSAEV